MWASTYLLADCAVYFKFNIKYTIITTLINTGQLCRKPLHIDLNQNIKIRPFSDFYLPGQTITYECVQQGSSLVGDSADKCGINGKWNVEAPTCVRGKQLRLKKTVLAAVILSSRIIF